MEQLGSPAIKDVFDRGAVESAVAGRGGGRVESCALQRTEYGTDKYAAWTGECVIWSEQRKITVAARITF